MYAPLTGRHKPNHGGFAAAIQAAKTRETRYIPSDIGGG